MANPALSQSTQQLLRAEETKLREQQQRRDQLTALIASKETDLTALDRELVANTESHVVYKTQQELLADQYEKTVDDRRAPETTRLEIAISSFKKGDPQQNALIDEIRSLDNLGNAGANRRVLYDSVISAANQRLTDLNEQLRELGSRINETRKLVTASQIQLQQLQTDKSALNEELASARIDLQNTLAGIENINLQIAEIKARRITAILTGLEIDQAVSRPALVVKIDNARPARPQAGINQADIVFVEEVEGRLTRLAAVFHSETPTEVGPVRSMRTSDLDLLAPLNGPLFANSGGNRGTLAALARSTLVNIGVGAASNLYYRSSTRRAPHNLFTNSANLWSVGSGFAGVGQPRAMFMFREPDNAVIPSAVPVSTVNINYGNSAVQYRWNGSSWDRTQDGSAMTDSAGVRVSPTTVIVRVTNYVRSAADSRSPEAVSVGSGEALIFTDGHVIQGTWARQNASAITTYTDSEGGTVSILPGQTWIELPRANSTTFS